MARQKKTKKPVITSVAAPDTLRGAIDVIVQEGKTKNSLRLDSRKWKDATFPEVCRDIERTAKAKFTYGSKKALRRLFNRPKGL